MNTLSLPPALAALAAAGHVRLVRLPGPVDGLVGSRVAIWAAEDDRSTPIGEVFDGRWRISDEMSGPWHLVNSADEAIDLPIHFGAIVGSARITDVLPVMDGDDLQTPMGDELVLGNGRLILCVGRNATDPEPDVSDQLPFLPGLKPGDHVAVLADAARCEDRCPACWGAGWIDTMPTNPPHQLERPCPADCTGFNVTGCDPIPHPGGDGPTFEWRPT